MKDLIELVLGLENSKKAIKQAIRDRNGVVSDSDKLESYPEIINKLEGGSKVKVMQLVNTWLSYPGEELDVTMFDTSSVSSLSLAFYNAQKIKNLNFSGWTITNRLTSLYTMFCTCVSLEYLDMHGWDTSNVTNYAYLFSSIVNCKWMDIDGWDFSKGTNVLLMFIPYGSNLEMQLTEIRGTFKGLGTKSNSVVLNNLPHLDNDSALRCINALADRSSESGTFTFSLHSYVKNKLTEELIAQITDKGWALA